MNARSRSLFTLHSQAACSSSARLQNLCFLSPPGMLAHAAEESALVSKSRASWSKHKRAECAPRGSSAGGSLPPRGSTASRARAAALTWKTRRRVSAALGLVWLVHQMRPAHTFAVSTWTSFCRTAWSRRSNFETGSFAPSSAGAAGYTSCAGPPPIPKRSSPRWWHLAGTPAETNRQGAPLTGLTRGARLRGRWAHGEY